MSDETLWSIIEQVPHADYYHPWGGHGSCPRCKLEAWSREHAAEWRCNNLNRTTHCADALGVPLDTPAKVDQ